MSRGILDRITNRDVVVEQAELLSRFKEINQEQAELIKVQSDAIAKFEGRVVEFTEELDRLHSRVLILIPPDKPGGEVKVESA